jgi:hypothetical protein
MGRHGMGAVETRASLSASAGYHRQFLGAPNMKARIGPAHVAGQGLW